MKLSIIIATYNRGHSLIRTLNSLLRQTLVPQEWEAVVVNNNSTDNTAELFDSFTKSNSGFNFHMVFEKEQGLSYARNRGIAESNGDYIAIIDDDEEVNPSFANAYVKFLDARPDLAAAGGKITPFYETEPPSWLSPYAERPIAGTLDLGRKPIPFKRSRYPGGGNMCIRRTAVEKYGAFDPQLGRKGSQLLGGEEKDLFQRLRGGGEEIWYVPDAEIKHIIPPERLTREYFVRLTRMTGRSERTRTLNISKSAFALRLVSEVVKWCATVVLGIIYLLSLRPAAAHYLFILRREITLGLLGY